ncbi:tRNA (adenine(58)-N(1))-methyltransferase non-catalytic subunit TRM6 [Puntigrus tetrazona]|uniref:tRNA (adenine(58)-N(1))-methyltransferase non-catalytic subunit TRM6 n=1 Tax=Puntigrus tetrazona TaxID=1606681 RepID=UPI001C8A7250|nr:tRNA (adenine(58)-N(1))-methyltransferase non-catalytic subunit TRM6 [Puntigrus tetrazona]XP_043075964.1 tRNA (adenine(58)-N(1))-methyltransferase non-catalytic subunit TRM6 [Puntigrus tetrazona]
MAECANDSDAEIRIGYGDYVVLKRGDVFKSVQIENKKKVIFEKQWFFLDNAVGQLYGAMFEIEAGGSLKLKAAKHSGDSLDSKEAGQDNRHIVDDGRSQKLTRDDIETLKEQGLKGQEIVQQLIDNSTTFKDKTEFAQEKYIKKKKKKYESDITILKPSTRLLAMMYHGREPGKICHLRYDTLAQILTLGNIHACSKIIVFETCAGLVLGSVMERMGGYGSVIQMYPGGGPTRAGMESSGFPSHFHKTLHDFPLCKVNALLAGTLDLSEKDADTEANCSGNRSESSQETSCVSKEKNSEPQSMEVSVDPQEEIKRAERERLREQRAQEKKVKMEEKRKKLASAAALLEGRNADGLVIASRFHPCPVLMGLLKFIAPSRPFVVYCQYREPLIECYTKLREQGGVINLRLTDSWLRHYQVLPNRTHPVLLMSGGGGYLLSGTTVAADAAKAKNQHKSEEPLAKRLKLDEISSSRDSSA